MSIVTFAQLRRFLLFTLCLAVVSLSSAFAEEHATVPHDTTTIPHDTARLLDTSLTHGSVSHDTLAQTSEHGDAVVDAHGAAGTTTHADGGHGEASHEEHEGPPHLPSLAGMLAKYLGHDYDWLEHWINPIYSALTSLIFIWIAVSVYKKRELIPGPFQNGVELIVESLHNFLYGILGEHTRRFVPYLGTVFIYIFVNNIWGIVPLGHSPSTSLNVTASLALCTFGITQYQAIKSFGLLGYLYHLIGEPKKPDSWVLLPIMIVVHLILTFVHIVGEFVKPASLAFRLFGNITGEDVLVAAFVALGVGMMAYFGSPVGLPLHIPFIFLGILLSAIQALVFTLLSTIYILMVLPHPGDEHH